MALQLAVVGQPQLLIAGLTFGIALPGRGGTFVAADVNGFVGEYFNQLFQDVLGELHGGGIGHVQHVARNAARRPYRVVAVRIAAVFRIGSHGGDKVAGHVNLGYNLNV